MSMHEAQECVSHKDPSKEESESGDVNHMMCKESSAVYVEKVCLISLPELQTKQDN